MAMDYLGTNILFLKLSLFACFLEVSKAVLMFVCQRLLCVLQAVSTVFVGVSDCCVYPVLNCRSFKHYIHYCELSATDGNEMGTLLNLNFIFRFCFS